MQCNVYSFHRLHLILIPSPISPGEIESRQYGNKSKKKYSKLIILSICLTKCFFSVFFSGNVFVLAAIWMERNLHSVANYLILSLAVADLMVACLVMPLGAVYEVSGCWNR